MDLELDPPNEPGNIDQLNRPENADGGLQSVVKLVDESTASVASNVKYQYDNWATSVKGGKSRVDRIERVHKENPPVLEHTTKAIAFYPMKEIETTLSHAKRDLTMSDRNTNFCKPCRRIFDGNGSFVLPMTKSEKGLYYSHWDAQMLKRSARSCPLCLLVNRAMGALVATNESISLHYDIVRFVEAWDVYGVRFSCYRIASDGLTGRRVFPTSVHR